MGPKKKSYGMGIAGMSRKAKRREGKKKDQDKESMGNGVSLMYY